MRPFVGILIPCSMREGHLSCRFADIRTHCWTGKPAWRHLQQHSARYPRVTSAVHLRRERRRVCRAPSAVQCALAVLPVARGFLASVAAWQVGRVAPLHQLQLQTARTVRGWATSLRAPRIADRRCRLSCERWRRSMEAAAHGCRAQAEVHAVPRSFWPACCPQCRLAAFRALTLPPHQTHAQAAQQAQR